jgi:hypothetical protein
MADTGPINIHSYGPEGNLGARADPTGSGRSGNDRSARHPEVTHADPDAPLSINRATEPDQLTNQMANLGTAPEPLNVFSTQKYTVDEA